MTFSNRATLQANKSSGVVLPGSVGCRPEATSQTGLAGCAIRLIAAGSKRRPRRPFPGPNPKHPA
jgi:hypothetical protein